MKILVIDDDEEITTMISKFLKLKKHECITTNDGKEGTKLLEKEKFDVVLLDLSMPLFSGYDIIDHLEKNGKIKENKIILFTVSHVNDEKMKMLIKKGIYSSIKKPIELNELLKAIESV